MILTFIVEISDFFKAEIKSKYYFIRNFTINEHEFIYKI